MDLESSQLREKKWGSQIGKLERGLGKSRQIWRVHTFFVLFFEVEDTCLFIKEKLSFVFVCLIGFNVDIGVKGYLRDVRDTSGLRTQVTRYKGETFVRLLGRSGCRPEPTILQRICDVTTYWRWSRRTASKIY